MLCRMWKETVTKDEMPNASLPLSFTVGPAVIRIISSELEDWDEEQNEAPRIQGEMASNLLHQSNTHKAAWGPPKGTEGAGRNVHQAIFNHFPALLTNQKDPGGPKPANVMPT